MNYHQTCLNGPISALPPRNKFNTGDKKHNPPE
jgi:hypothetical protein